MPASKQIWTGAFLLAQAGLFIVQPTVGLAQESPAVVEQPGYGLSLGLFYFLSGVGPGVVLDHPLEWNQERKATVEAWAALAGGGAATSVSIQLGGGVVRGGIGAMMFGTSRDFGGGPGFGVGIGTPFAGRQSALQIRASFQAYFTTAGYVPSVRIVLGRWSSG